MLFILTGEIQTGKTRWLHALINKLETAQIAVYGVLTPGIWREFTTNNKTTCYEKLGIEAILYPDKIKIPFAWKRGLQSAVDAPTVKGAEVASAATSNSAVTLAAEVASAAHSATRQAAASDPQTGFAWVISDKAIASVNSYFDVLAARLTAQIMHEEQSDLAPLTSGLLIVDELGTLELKKNAGFTSALWLLEQESCKLYKHALVVVRKPLLAVAKKRFAKLGSEVQVIVPDEGSLKQILGAFE